MTEKQVRIILLELLRELLVGNGFRIDGRDGSRLNLYVVDQKVLVDAIEKKLTGDTPFANPSNVNAVLVGGPHNGHRFVAACDTAIVRFDKNVRLVVAVQKGDLVYLGDYVRGETREDGVVSYNYMGK
jgi:hypothetical protein